MALNKQARYGLDAVDEETFRIRLRIGKVIGRRVSTRKSSLKITFQHFHNKKYFCWIMKIRQAVAVTNSWDIRIGGGGRIVVLMHEGDKQC